MDAAREHLSNVLVLVECRPGCVDVVGRQYADHQAAVDVVRCPRVALGRPRWRVLSPSPLTYWGLALAVVAYPARAMGGPWGNAFLLVLFLGLLVAFTWWAIARRLHRLADLPTVDAARAARPAAPLRFKPVTYQTVPQRRSRWGWWAAAVVIVVIIAAVVVNTRQEDQRRQKETATILLCYDYDTFMRSVIDGRYTDADMNAGIAAMQDRADVAENQSLAFAMGSMLDPITHRMISPEMVVYQHKQVSQACAQVGVTIPAG